MTNKWIAGARPRTLPAAIAPVLVGTALAIRLHTTLSLFNALLALLVSLALQVAVNYSNDYSDGIKGTDENRVGPIRLVGSGLATAEAVKRAAIISFGFAALVGTYLAARTSFILIVIGIASIAAAWTYTGSSKPYGYRGFGEISVFLFFGVVATVGTYYAATENVSWQAFLLSLPVGALSCALLAINNLRDLPKDSLVGKRTLAVRMGDIKARAFFIGLLVAAHLASLIAAVVTPWAMATLLLAPITGQVIRSIVSGARGVDLIPLLGKTGRLQMLLSTTLAIALLI
jgi:1,4-dihydroxy-2-naphthoate octaprenyltransferase